MWGDSLCVRIGICRRCFAGLRRRPAVSVLQNGPTATQVAAVAATSIAASPMRIVDANLNQANVGNSAVTVSNISQEPVDLGRGMLLVNNYKVTLPKNELRDRPPEARLDLAPEQFAVTDNWQ
jgi:hypothetical protein